MKIQNLFNFSPHETFHVRTRKFLQQEVFKTETHRSVPLEQVIGRCYVMNVKEYFKFRPEGNSFILTPSSEFYLIALFISPFLSKNIMGMLYTCNIFYYFIFIIF